MQRERLYELPPDDAPFSEWRRIMLPISAHMRNVRELPGHSRAVEQTRGKPAVRPSRTKVDDAELIRLIKMGHTCVEVIGITGWSERTIRTRARHFGLTFSRPKQIGAYKR